MIKMFRRFKVNFRIKTIQKGFLRKDGTETYKFYVSCQQVDSVFNFLKNIGYKYNKEREIACRYAYQYLLSRKIAIEKWKRTIESLRKKHREKEISYKKIMKLLNRSESDVFYLLNHGRLKTLHGLNFPDFRAWLNDCTKNLGDGLVWETVESIDFQGKDNVKDITTNDIHNFIGNGFLVHNCVTENLGIEKIVKNIITNPNIRFLIICGRPSMGHFVDNALESLVENGVNDEKRIIGAKGSIPVLKNLSDEEIERFRKQIDIINISGNINKEEIMKKVEEYYNKNPGPFKGEVVSMEEVKEIIAEKHPISDWVKDPKGFFTIHVSRNDEIVVEHHDNSGSIIQKIIGKSAEDIYHKIIKMNIISSLEHAAYLGRELAKAEVALRNQMTYEQDAELISQAPVNTDGKTLQPIPRYGKLVSVRRIETTKEVILTYVVNDKEFPTTGLTSKDEEKFKEFLKSRGLSRIF
jgi:tetrahydromethanopterin S-methyltransferase subunit A